MQTERKEMTQWFRANDPPLPNNDPQHVVGRMVELKLNDKWWPAVEHKFVKSETPSHDISITLVKPHNDDYAALKARFSLVFDAYEEALIEQENERQATEKAVQARIEAEVTARLEQQEMTDWENKKPKSRSKKSKIYPPEITQDN